MKLPESWVECRLSTLLNALAIGNRPIGGIGDIEEGIPSISGEHFDWNGEFDFSSLKYIPEDYFESLKNGQLKNGDILIVKDGATTGKCAYISDDFPFKKAAINEHVFLVRVNQDILSSRYLYELLRSEYGKAQILRNYRGAAIGGITRSFSDYIKLPLPVLQEQQRIVDVLQNAESITKTKRLIAEKINQLVKTLYWEYFSTWYTADGLRDPVRISEYIADSQYGVSEAMEESGNHAVLRMNSMSTAGWLDLTDLKYANLSEKDSENTKLKNGDILFNRTNSKELVGKCAIWRGERNNFSFASYLIRLRLNEGMLPEFLWATLNSAYGKYRLFNSAKQAVSMANVSPTDLGRITVPLPPLELQERFARLVRQIEELRNEMLNKIEDFNELQSLVTQQALIGEFTSDWREQNQNEIADAVIVRDELLRKHGTKITKRSVEDKKLKTLSEFVKPTRRWLLDELSEFQNRVFDAFIAYPDQPLLAEDQDHFSEFCENETLKKKLTSFDYSPNKIRRTLGQLASLGLIAKVTLPKTNSLTQEIEYLKAFRPLREDEDSKLRDAAALKRSLKSQENYYFEATLDYATSSRAGASGMFQVVALSDDRDRDRTSLVDQGRHYDSVQALKIDIAKALKVDVEQIDLDTVGGEPE